MMIIIIIIIIIIIQVASIFKISNKYYVRSQAYRANKIWESQEELYTSQLYLCRIAISQYDKIKTTGLFQTRYRKMCKKKIVTPFSPQSLASTKMSCNEIILSFLRHN